jgi:hypothetical protein
MDNAALSKGTVSLQLPQMGIAPLRWLYFSVICTEVLFGSADIFGKR